MQLKHLAQRKGHKRGLIVKPRQLGWTTLYCIDLLDDALWVQGMSCAIIAHERETLDGIFQIVKRAYDNLPPQIKPLTRTDTTRRYRFDKTFDGHQLDSEIYVALKLRGGTVRRLHITESAYIKDRDELKTGSKQAVPKDGYITEETTGNGMEGFYDDYMEAYEKMQKGQLTPIDYMPYFYAWFENPEYSLDGEMPEITEDDKFKFGDEIKLKSQFGLNDGQLLWRRWKIEELKSRNRKEGISLTPLQSFMQEYPATVLEAFQSGAGNVFDLTRLMDMRSVDPHNPLSANRLLIQEWDQKSAQEKEDITKQLNIFKELFLLGIKIWHFPNKEKRYVIGVDPSDGEGSDNTCIDVWEVPKETTGALRQAAQFYAKIRPDKGAEIARALAEYYNHAFVGVENNMLTFILFLSKIYDNYYTKVEIDKKNGKRTTQLGWNTNTKTRDPMIDGFVILYEDNYLEINSAITISEMKTFVTKDNGKREHATGKHDDSLIAAMIGIEMRKYEPKQGRVFYKLAQGF